MILFHDFGYRYFKHFYLEKVCKHLRHLFPNVVSYNRLVELESRVKADIVLSKFDTISGKKILYSLLDRDYETSAKLLV